MASHAVKNRKRHAVEFWNSSEKYFDVAGSEKTKPLLANPALKRLFKLVKPGDAVLDVGCGEGSKLAQLQREIPRVKCTGVDISRIGIKRAKKQYPKIDFRLADSEHIPYKENTFDVAYSAYVFEHTTNPQRILDEMIRVTKPGGHVVIVCPNFGSPIYPSPVTPILAHFKRAVARDAKYVLSKPKALEWYPQEPVLTPDWQADFDTTILPYTYSLKQLHPKARVSSTWFGMPAGNTWKTRMMRAPFKILGLLQFYPFKWWGSTVYFELKVNK